MNDAAKEFFDSLPKETESEPDFNIFEEVAPEKDKSNTDKIPAEQVENTEEGFSEKEPERKKPLRSERRAEQQREYYEKQLQEEREARIRLEEQVKAIQQGNVKEVDPDIRRLLTEVKDPEEATEIFQNLLAKAQTTAEERAYQRFLEAQSEGDDEVNAIHSQIEQNLEAIEDRFGVDLTDDTATRNAFLDFVEGIAPEGSDALPNMQTAWQLFQSTRKAPPSNVERKQQIGARSMVRSTNAKPTAEDLKPMGFEQLRGDIWDRIIGKK